MILLEQLFGDGTDRSVGLGKEKGYGFKYSDGASETKLFDFILPILREQIFHDGQRDNNIYFIGHQLFR